MEAIQKQPENASSPKFSNASKLIVDGLCRQRELQFIRVKGKTANITNGQALIRRFADAPDGMYHVNIQGALVPAKCGYIFNYPDVELMRPPFETMRPCCEIPNNILGQMREFCAVCNQRSSSILMTSGGLTMATDDSVTFKYPFRVQDDIHLNSSALEIIIIEMLQYPMIYLLKEQDIGTDGTTTPLIFGLDWGCCGIIMPNNGRYRNR